MRNYIFIFLFAFFPAKLWGLCGISLLGIYPNHYTEINVNSLFLVDYDRLYLHLDTVHFYLVDSLGNEIALTLKDEIRFEETHSQKLLQPEKSLQANTQYTLLIKSYPDSLTKKRFTEEFPIFSWKTSSNKLDFLKYPYFDCQISLNYPVYVAEYISVTKHYLDSCLYAEIDSFRVEKIRDSIDSRMTPFLEGYYPLDLAIKYEDSSNSQSYHFLKVENENHEFSYYFVPSNLALVTINQGYCSPSPFYFAFNQPNYSFHLTLLSETGEVFGERDKIVEWR